MTQREAVLTALQERGRVSAMELLTDYGIYRAAARIADLRRDGYDIETIDRRGDVAVYVLKDKAPVSPVKPGGTPAPAGPVCPKCGIGLTDVKPSPIDGRYVVGRCPTHKSQPVRVGA